MKQATFEYAIGETVYLRLSEDKASGFVTGIIVRPLGVCYYVTWTDTRTETIHYDFELTREFEPSY